MLARTQEILQRDDTSLVFGMEWFPLLGDNTPKQAQALARRRRASHWVLAAGAAASVGLMRGAGLRGEPTRLYSAAAIFAGLYPVGTVVAVTRLPQDRLWLVAVHEGAVMARTDQLHDGEASVQDTIRLLREAHPGLVVHDESRMPAGLLDALFQAAHKGAQVLRNHSRVWRGVAIVLVAGGVALWFTRAWWNATEASLQAQQPDPVQAWAQAVAMSARSHSVHGVAGLKAALDALYELPVYLAGWMLKQAECRPGTAHWNCRAVYRRNEEGDNESLMDAALPQWSLSFEPLEGAVANWAVPLPALPASEIKLHGSRHNEARLVSALQSMLPAFMELRLEGAQRLAVAAPLDAQQRPIPRPREIPVYQRRPVRLQAPLRSLSLLLPETGHMSWDKILLELGEVDHPSIRHSGLRVSLSGVLYEIDDSDDSSAATGLVSAPFTGRGR